jgi:SAM-dependent methyltransferase
MRSKVTIWSVMLIASLASIWIMGCKQKRDTDVEFVPTPQPVVIEMLKMAGVNKNDVVYDLGCGDGRIVITAAKVFGARGVGVDIDPFNIKYSKERARKEGVTDRVKFIEGDFFQTKLNEATVVALYLTPDLNKQLRPIFFRDLKPGSRIVSHDFNMGDWKPDNIGRLHDIKHEYPDSTSIRDAPFYYWVIPANAAGTWRGAMPPSAGMRYAIRFIQKYQHIGGVITLGGRDQPVTDARLIGDHVSFTFHHNVDGEQMVMWFYGRISGNVIQGNVEVRGGSSAGNYNWTAKRDR